MLLAMIPAMILCTTTINAQRLFQGVFVIVFLMAVYSSVRYLGWGDRAYLPLLGPNNYVTLLYLVWIPWLHGELAVGQHEPHTKLLVIGVVVFCL